jgi:hypothetical protein
MQFTAGAISTNLQNGERGREAGRVLEELEFILVELELGMLQRRLYD